MAMPALRPGHALRPLLSLQARSLLYGLGFRGGRGCARLLGAAALIVLLAGMAVAYMWLLGGSMVAVGAAGAIPALAALAGSLAAVALVFVKAPGTVFGCRDYDLVAALPVPVRTVVLARTAPLYGFGAVLSALLSAPLYVAYFSAVSPTPGAVATAVVVSVLAPLAPAAVATLLSLALTSVAVRFRHAGAVQLVLSVLVVTGIVVGSFALGGASSGADDAAALAAIYRVFGIHDDLLQLRTTLKGRDCDFLHGSGNEHTADGNMFFGRRRQEIFADLRNERFADALGDLGNGPAPFIRTDDNRSVLPLSERPLFFEVFDRLLPRSGAFHRTHLREQLICIAVGEICAFVFEQRRLCLGIALFVLQQFVDIVRPQHLLREHQLQQRLPTKSKRKQAFALRSDIPKIFVPRPTFLRFACLIRRGKP